jgi:hypothetical protein
MSKSALAIAVFPSLKSDELALTTDLTIFPTNAGEGFENKIVKLRADSPTGH